MGYGHDGYVLEDAPMTFEVPDTSYSYLSAGGHLDLSERVDLSYLGLRALGGLQAEVTPEVRLALAVRSPGVRVLGWGSATRVVSAAVLLPGAPPSEYQVIEELPHGTGSSVVEPVRLYAGLRWARGRWSAARSPSTSTSAARGRLL